MKLIKELTTQLKRRATRQKKRIVRVHHYGVIEGYFLLDNRSKK